MHHAVDALLELDERTVRGHVAHLAAHARADGIIVADHVPRIGLKLADAEGDLLLILLDTQHDRVQILPDLENLGRLGDALRPGHFRDMHEPLDTGLDLHEGPVGHEVDDLAPDLGADGELVLDVVPRILGGLFQPEGNPFLLAVDLDDHDLDLLALFEHFARVGNAAPAHVGDMEQAIHAIQIDERSEIGDVLDDAFADLPRLDALQQVAALLVPLFLDELPARQDDVLAVQIDLEDLEIVGLAQILVEVLGRLDVDVRCREEGVDPDADDETPLDLGLDAAGNDRALRTFLENVIPVLLLLRQIVGDDGIAVLVFELLEDHLHG